MEPQQKNRQVLIGLLVVVAAIVAMVQFGLSTNEIYSLQPVQLLEDSDQYLGRDLRLIGVVRDGSIEKDLRQTRLDFHVSDRPVPNEAGVAEVQHVPVTYIGAVVPDTFKDGSEVVIEGTFDGSKFHATHIMTKCPSKYDTDPEYADRKVASV